MKTTILLPLSLSVLLCAAVAPAWAADSAAEVPVSSIRLTDSRGEVSLPLAEDGRKATVLFFLTPDCPAGNRYSPEIARISQEYEQRGVRCFAVYADTGVREVREHLSAFRLPLRGLVDPEQKLAALTGATVTPETAVLSPAGALLYRGRIDDRGVKLGTFRGEPRTRDLRDSLEAVLSGRPVPRPVTKAVGCYLPARSSGKP